MPIRMRIGEIARQQDLTIKALAERAALAYNTAHALYTSRATRIDLDTLDRICTALRVTPGDLLVRDAAQEPVEHVHEGGGSHEGDSARPAGASGQRTAGAL